MYIQDMSGADNNPADLEPPMNAAPVYINAPQGVTILDDSKDLIVSRTIARIKTHGLDVEYVGVDPWEAPRASGGNVTKYRTWELSVVKGQKSVGSVSVRETYRTIEKNRELTETLCAGVVLDTKALHEALGVKWNDGN